MSNFVYLFDRATVRLLQELLEKAAHEHNLKVAANADPLVDGVEPNFLPIDDVVINVGAWDLPAFGIERMADYVNFFSDFWDRVRGMSHGNIIVWVPQYDRSFSEWSWFTRPTQIARFIGGEKLLNDTACVTVDGVLWDFNRVLEKSCTLCFVSSSSPEGRNVIAHSSMHLLGQILELKFGCLLWDWKIDPYGQFYHEIVGRKKVNEQYVYVKVTQEDLITLQSIADMVIHKNFRFERVSVKKADLLEMFGYSQYRVDQINENIADDSYGLVYRCGAFIDLDLSGVPHVRETSILKGFEIIKDLLPNPIETAGGTTTRVYATTRLEDEEDSQEDSDKDEKDSEEHSDEEDSQKHSDHANREDTDEGYEEDGMN